jgi:hypothetical protein
MAWSFPPFIICAVFSLPVGAIGGWIRTLLHCCATTLTPLAPSLFLSHAIIYELCAVCYRLNLYSFLFYTLRCLTYVCISSTF